MSRSADRIAQFCMGFALSLVLIVTINFPAMADVWVMDKQNSSVRFTWNHLGLSRQSGQFLDVDGRLQFTPTDPTSGSINVAIKTGSVFTGVPEYDSNLKSGDFFNVAEHPIITFKSTSVRVITEKTGEVDGELTIRGVTNPVTLQVMWNFSGEHPFAPINPTFKGKWASGFSATTTVLRSAWGLTRALPLIGDEIRITIEAEFLLKG